MSNRKPLFNFGIADYFVRFDKSLDRNHPVFPKERFINNTSRFLYKRLTRCAEFLSEHGLFFEASQAEDLCEICRIFSNKTNPSSDDFEIFWNDLTEFGEIEVNISGVDRQIVHIANLPIKFP